MVFKETAIEGVYVIEPHVFNDARGYFFEAWKHEEFTAHVGPVQFIQDNESKSSYGVLRLPYSIYSVHSPFLKT